MEVKEVRSTPPVSELSGREVTKRSEAGDAPPASKAVSPVTVDISAKLRSGEVNEFRRKANAVIGAINLAGEAATEIDRLVRSIGGIVEQVADPAVADRKRRVLEREANELVQEIKVRANSASPEGVKPLAGDKVELEIERQLGKTLEIIFPDDAKNSFGIDQLDFSEKDTIIQARVVVAKAREQVERIKESVKDSSEQVRAAVSTLDVAVQNSEAAEATIRDLDAALKLVSEARGEINADPSSALGSVGALESKALTLLRG